MYPDRMETSASMLLIVTATLGAESVLEGARLEFNIQPG
jgi:hypothetical protein